MALNSNDSRVHKRYSKFVFFDKNTLLLCSSLELLELPEQFTEPFKNDYYEL